MEQKQLDEVEESFFGEEFIDDDLLENSEEEVKVEPAKAAKEWSKSSNIKAQGSLDEDKKSSTKKAKVTKKSTAKEIGKEPKVEILKEDIVKESNKKDNGSNVEEKKSLSSGAKNPLDPWKDEEEDVGLFKEASTWKAITGVVVILLIFSVFTQGFNFSDSSVATGAETVSTGNEISLAEAETKVINYVNNNLLQGAPFLAELYSSKELDSLYQVTVAVAGETVDSYITKDGQLFFPQGFDITVNLEGQLESPDTTAGSTPGVEEVGESKVVEGLEEQEQNLAEVIETKKPETVPEIIEKQPEPQPVMEVLIVPINAKRWFFSPNKVMATKGDILQLNIIPTDLEFTFAIPGLGIEQVISGPTKVEFTANKVGSFAFECSDCSGKQKSAMIGTLVVE
jgi:hypothetical protein